MNRLIALISALLICAVAVAQTPKKDYKIGDVVTVDGTQGIVFQTSPKILVVSVDEAACKWHTDTNITLGLKEKDNGKLNLKEVNTVKYWQGMYASFRWCEKLGESWYLPAINELSALYAHKNEVNSVLSSMGKPLLAASNSDQWMWSSTRYGGAQSHCISFADGIECGVDSWKECAVRGVCVLDASATSGPYKVGDYYSGNGKQGVVFDVTADGRHGKILSLEQSGKLWWAWDDEESKIRIGASSRTDGEVNTAKVRAREKWEKYEAFVWVFNLGEGWYMPAIEELEKILKNDAVRESINATLQAHNATKLLDRGTIASYWSSTEVEASQCPADKCYAWSISMSLLKNYNTGKTVSNYVRAVAEF